MIFRRVFLTFVLLLTVAFLNTGVVFAETGFCTGNESFSADPKVNTALGCIPVTVQGFVTWLLPNLFTIAGGIAFILMIYGFILLITSNGDPKAVSGAQETITSAVVGLLLSIFSLFILRLIMVDILKIPGLN